MTNNVSVRLTFPKLCVITMSLVGAIFFLGSSVGTAEISALVQKDSRAEQLQIPSDLGVIEERYVGSNPRTVLFIQDAHDSLEAQVNISKIIQRVVAKESITTVFEEGYEGPVPTEKLFGAVQDFSTKQKIAYFLMDHLRVGGAEYAHILNPKSFRLIGVDSFEWLNRHQALSQAMRPDQAAVQADLNEMDGVLLNLARLRLSETLKTGVLLRMKLEKKQLDEAEYLRRLWRLQCTENEAGCQKEYPVFSRLMASGSAKVLDTAWEKKTDRREIAREMQLFEEQFFRGQAQTVADKEILGWIEGLRYLRELNRCQITGETYEKMRNRMAQWNTESFLAFISKYQPQKRILSRAWETHLRRAESFYGVTLHRDRVIARDLLEWRDHSENSDAILVYGGFHRKAITEILKKLGLSYVVVSPRIRELSERHQRFYRQLVGSQYHGFEYLWGFGRGYRAPSFFRIAEENPSAVGEAFADLQKRVSQGEDLVQKDITLSQKVLAIRAELRSSDLAVATFPSEHSELLALQAQLLETEKRALELEAQADFGRQVAGLIHDANNTLGIIQLAVGAAKTVSGSETKRFLKMAIDASALAGTLMRAAMTVARPESGIKITLDIHDSIRSVLTFMRHSVEKKNKIRIVTDFQSKDLIRGDASQLVSVLLNLVKNAEQAILAKRQLELPESPNKDAISVITKTMPGGREVQVSVWDSGIGIKPEDLKKVFLKRFTTKSDGNGLGLLRVKKIVEEHGGRLEVFSTYGKGTEFRMIFPVAQNAVSMSSAPTLAAKEAGASVLEFPGGVLVFEEDSNIRHLWNGILEFLVPKEVSRRILSSVEANMFLKGPLFPRSLIITEPFMNPGSPSSGTDFLIRLRKAFPDSFIVVVSGEISEDQLRVWKQQNLINDALSKPFDFNAVERKMAGWNPAVRSEVRLRNAASGMAARILPLIQKMQRNQLRDRYTVFLSWQSLMQLSPRQFRQDVEKMTLRHPQVQWVIHDADPAMTGPHAMAIQDLKKQLGTRRILFSPQSFLQVVPRFRARGRMIQVMGKTSRTDNDSEIFKKYRWVRFQYEADEIGVIPTALLYSESGLEFPFQRVIRMSMIDNRIREAVERYLGDLVIQASA